MNHIYNYIIKISNELNDTFKTESGLELYGSKQFSHNRLANRYATIVGQPLIFDGQILEVGTNVIIDPSVYYHSVHGDNDLKQYTTNTIDREKGIYSIEPQNIVLYWKNDKWNGYMNNFLGKCIVEDEEEKLSGNIVVEIATKKRTNKYEIIYLNKFLKECEVDRGDVLYMKPNMGVSVWLDGKEHTWLRNEEVLAKQL